MEEPQSFIPDPNLLQTMLEMGCTKCDAEEALYVTGNKSVDDAINYLFKDEDGDGSEGDMGYYKMVFVVNTSLKMGIGKIAAQVAHATLGLYRDLIKQESMREILDYWENIGEKKIVLKGTDHIQLQELYENAKSCNVPCYLIQDAGKTQIPANSVTVLSLFGLEDDVNKVTGSLALL